MLPIETSQMTVDTERADDLDDLLDLMTTGDDHRYRYSVAWIDLLARGRSARPQRADSRRARSRRGADAPDKRCGRWRTGPATSPPCRRSCPGRGLLNHATIAAFNEVWFRAAPRRRVGEIVAIPRFFHPLDAIGSWNRLYGRRGLVQYQFLVPFGARKRCAHVVTRFAETRHAELPVRAQAVRTRPTRHH